MWSERGVQIKIRDNIKEKSGVTWYVTMRFVENPL